MARIHQLPLILPLLACSPTPTSAPSDEPASPTETETATADEPGLRMPAAGEYMSIRDPAYGHLRGAAKAPVQGELAPDFELPTHTGATLRLSEALADGPVVLMFYRGFW